MLEEGLVVLGVVVLFLDCILIVLWIEEKSLLDDDDDDDDGIIATAGDALMRKDMGEID